MTAMTDFPDDENGEVLRQMADAGVDLAAERAVEFAHLAPDEGAAHAQGSGIAQTGQGSRDVS